MTRLRLLLVLSFLAFAAASHAQVPDTLDYSLRILEGGVPISGGEIVYALVVNSDWWTITLPAFEVRLVVPEGIEPPRRCMGELEDLQFDRDTRVLVWPGRFGDLAERSCPLIFRIDPSMMPGTIYSLSATLSIAAPDRNPSNNSATFTRTVVPASDLEVTSDVDVRRYKPGTTVTYTLSLTNHGPQDAQDVLLIDQVSPFLTPLSFEVTGGPAASISGTEARIPLLRAHERMTFRLVARAKSDFESAEIGNRVTASTYSTIDVHENNNESAVWTFAGPDADLSLSRSRKRDEPIVIEIANDGPDAVNDAVVSHALMADAEEVKFLRITPSQGTCSEPVQTTLIITPPMPPHWEVKCSLGPLASGSKATIAMVVDKAASFRLISSAGPVHNDPKPQNNVEQVVFDPAVARRRAR